MSNDIGVILFLQHEAQRQRFAQALSRAGCAICDRSSLEAMCDLIVADRLDLSELDEPLRAAQTRGDIGLIQIGTLCGGDVVLPSDCSTRELVLACQLLAQVVRLRRAERRQRAARRAWQRLAQRDELTNIPNRRMWNRALHARLAGDQSGSEHCLVMLDVDNFKTLNDQLGHPIGDAVLKAIADAFRRTLRRGDLAARLGGDEFAVLLCELQAEAVHNVVERIRRTASAAATQAAGCDVALSAGFAILRNQHAAEAMEAADAALRQAKLVGGDVSRSFSERESADLS